MAKNWFATLFRRNSRTAQPRRRLPRHKWTSLIPLMEFLEIRLAPAIRTWTGASLTSQNWSDPRNWGGNPPTAASAPTDDLVFPATLAAGASFLTNNDLASGTFH